MTTFPSDVAFTPAVKAVQVRNGSRENYARMEAGGGWETTVTPELAEYLAGLEHERTALDEMLEFYGSFRVELANQHQMLYKFLLNKWYFDELYDLIFVRPAKWIGRFLWKKGDGFVIDGFGPDGVSARVLDVTRNVVRLQTGYLYHYAFAMLIGVAGLITWFMFGLGGQ